MFRWESWGVSQQIVAQQHVEPRQAAILLSLEAVFAVLGGWMLLNETLSGRELVGCMLMFAGMLLSQLPGLKRERDGHSKSVPGTD